MTINITPEITQQFLNDLCNNVDIDKHMIEGPRRSYGSYGITFSKSLNAVCKQNPVVLNAVHNTLTDYLTVSYNHGYNDGYLRAASDLSTRVSNSDFRNGILIGAAVTGVCVLANKGYKKYRQYRLDKEQKNETVESSN